MPMPASEGGAPHANRKVYHHHTPRFYLLPWADERERILWLGYGKIERSKLRVVGGENDFYKLQELTPEDVRLCEAIIEMFPEVSRKTHRDLLRMFATPHAIRRAVTTVAPLEREALLVVDDLISNINEDYHAAIERDFQRFLSAMRAGDASFYPHDEEIMSFFHGLAVQYMRTKAMKDRMLIGLKFPPETIERVWSFLSHSLATSLGGSLFVDRRQFKIVLLNNHTLVPFITSDQPIINILADGETFQPPEKVELYYPLSPARAMLFLEAGNRQFDAWTEVSLDQAHDLNLRMVRHAGRQIFSNSPEYLRVIKDCQDRGAGRRKNTAPVNSI